MQHHHMSTSGFDSPSKDMLETIEPTNDISTLVDGATTEPNIELNKCNCQASKQVSIVEVMATNYNIVIVLDGPNFLDVLPKYSTSESLQCTHLYIEDIIIINIPSNVDKGIVTTQFGT